MSNHPVPTNPLHPSVIPLLDPEYIAFHNAVLQYAPPVRTVPLKPNRRDEFDLIANDPLKLSLSCEPHKVGEEHDFDLLHAKIHTWTPDGVAPRAGWPILIFFHGGTMYPYFLHLLSSHQAFRWFYNRKQEIRLLFIDDRLH
jgi:hypothetical protein